MGTYGDSAKTKTITTRKYGRIVALLRATDKNNQQSNGSTTGGSGTGSGSGEVSNSHKLIARNRVLAANSNLRFISPKQPSGSEAAKFRLWVKSKGFTLGPATPGRPGGVGGVLDGECGGDVLYLPTGTDKVSEARLCAVASRRFSLHAYTQYF